MSTNRGPHEVDSLEVEQWVQAVFTYIDTGRADAVGGVAPRTIKEVTGTERTTTTIKTHLEKDHRVTAVEGVALGHGGRRTSFEPQGDLA